MFYYYNIIRIRAERYSQFRSAQQIQNIFITFIQCWTNVEDVGPTLYKCYTNVLCLLGGASLFVLLLRTTGK